MIETLPIIKPCLIELETDEITALCPINKLPDFGSLSIHYMADTRAVELKAFKEYLQTYRNLPISQEDFAATILDEITQSCNPISVDLSLDYQIRGGIKTTVHIDWKREDSTPILSRIVAKPKTITELLNVAVGVLTIEDCCKVVSTPVNFVHIGEYFYIVVDGRSKKAQMIKKTEQGTLVIHHEYPEPENWQKTSSLLISGPIYKILSVFEEEVYAEFRKKYSWYKDMEELCKDELDQDVILCLELDKDIYSTGEGIMNPGGQ